MDTQIQLIHNSNLQFVKKEQHALKDKTEILTNLELQLSDKPIQSIARYGCVYIPIILMLILAFGGGGSILLFSIAMISDFLVSFSLLSLLFSVVSFCVGLLGLYLYGFPTLRSAYKFSKFLYARTSPEKMYSFLLQHGNLTNGVVQKIKKESGLRLIDYSFQNNSIIVARTFQTQSQRALTARDKVYILHYDNVAILL